MVRPSRSEVPIHLLCFNVLRSNRQYEVVLDALRGSKADILYLTELDSDWRDAIEPLRSIYPHHIGNGANVLLSRFPLEQARASQMTFDDAQTANLSTGGPILPIPDSLRPHWWSHEILMAKAVIGSRRLNLVGLHLPTPRSALSLLIQKATSLVIAPQLREADDQEASVILGDLNTSSFSPTFRFIKQHSQLRDSAPGFGYSPTWGPLFFKRSWLPWLGTSIDHILVSKNTVVTDRQTGSNLGSDHRWVRASVIW